MRRIRFDPEKCTGCAACQLACNDQRDILCALHQKPLRHMEQREKNEKFWTTPWAVSTAENVWQYVRKKPFPEMKWAMWFWTKKPA